MEEGKTFLEQVPEEYRESPWAKENTATPEDFFKFVDNQNKLVGAKGIIPPGENASPEELTKFQVSLGRPESADGYLFANPEGVTVERNAETDKMVKGLLLKHGIPKTAGEGLVKDYETLLHSKMTEAEKAAKAKDEAQDRAFGEFNTKLFGDKKDVVVANAQKFLKETLPSEALPIFDKLDSESLSLVIAATHGIAKKFGKEDSFTGGAGTGTGSIETYEELSAKQRELMKNPAFRDFRHVDHEKVQAQNKELMDKMRAVSKK